MKDWKPAAGALICSCIFLLGEAGEFVKHTSKRLAIRTAWISH